MKKLMVVILSFIGLVFSYEAEGKLQVVSQKELTDFYKKFNQAGYTDQEIADLFADDRAKLLRPPKKRAKPLDYFFEELGIFKPESISRGQKVIEEKKNILEAAEGKFRVEKEAIVSIFRIETDLATFLGDEFVFNYLYRLFVLKKKTWAKKELLCFLRLCKINGYDPLSIKGSWAGAFGYWQFMPSTFLSYARDWDGDGKIDLFSFKDGAFNAAYYLSRLGWQYGDLDKNKKVLWRYNNDDDYVLAVICYAKLLRLKLDAV